MEYAVFVLMAFKIIASFFSVGHLELLPFSAQSIPMLFVWLIDLNDSSGVLFAFKSPFGVVLLGLYILAFLISPWLTISKKSGVQIVGSSFVIGINLFDIISCILSALPIWEKAINISFSALMVGLSIWIIYKIVT